MDHDRGIRVGKYKVYMMQEPAPSDVNCVGCGITVGQFSAGLMISIMRGRYSLKDVVAEVAHEHELLHNAPVRPW